MTDFEVMQTIEIKKSKKSKKTKRGVSIEELEQNDQE